MCNLDKEVMELAKEVEAYIRENNKEKITMHQVQRLFRVGFDKTSRAFEVLRNDGVLIEADGCHKVIK